jgi:hypothetical protein
MIKKKNQMITVKIFLYSVFTLLLCDSLIFGQGIKKIGTSSAAFLRIPAGAKAISMGSAFTAIADDGSAMFWNPGNITDQIKTTLFVHHTPWLPGLTYDYLAFTMPVSNLGVIGLNVVSLRTQEIEITTLEAQMGTGETYTAASTAVGITFARKLTDRFSIGGSIKYISEKIFNCTATAFAFDIGTMFITPFKDVRLGVSISNVGTEMRINGDDLNSYVDIAPDQHGNNDNIVGQMKTNGFSLPIIMRLGLSYDLLLSAQSRLTFACDGVNPNDNAQSVNTGIEFAPLGDLLFIRGGYNDLFLKDAEMGLTLGAGLNLSAFDYFDLSFSYAYQSLKYLGDINHISIELKF